MVQYLGLFGQFRLQRQAQMRRGIRVGLKLGDLCLKLLDMRQICLMLGIGSNLRILINVRRHRDFACLLTELCSLVPEHAAQAHTDGDQHHDHAK